MAEINPELVGMDKPEVSNLDIKTREMVNEINNIIEMKYGKSLNRQTAKDFVGEMMNKVDMVGNFVEENETELLNLANLKNKWKKEVDSLDIKNIGPIMKPFEYAEEMNKKFYTSTTWRAIRDHIYRKMVNILLSIIESEKGVEIERLNIEATREAYTSLVAELKQEISEQRRFISDILAGRQFSPHLQNQNKSPKPPKVIIDNEEVEV